MKRLLAMMLTLALTMNLSACAMNNPKAEGDGQTEETGTAANEDAADGAGEEGGEADSSQAASESAFVYDPNDQYPGMVVYRDQDPEADLDVEITSTDQITWTVAVCLQESNPQSMAVKLMAEELAEKTNGNFVWDVFYNSTLGSESEAVELVRNNTVQFVTSNVTVMSPYVDAFGVFAMPYLFHTEEDELTYLSTSEKAAELYKELEETANLVTLGFNCTGSRCLSTTGVPRISSPEDLKAVKVRSMEAQVWQDVISCMGATPVPVAYTELYTALQTGVVQGQDNPVANTVDGKFYEVLDTYYETDHSYLVSGYYTNPTAWDALPDDYKALVAGLMEKYQGNYYHQEVLKFREDCTQVIVDAGVEIVGQDELDMDAFYAGADAMIEKTYMTDPKYVEIINDVKAVFQY